MRLYPLAATERYKDDQLWINLKLATVGTPKQDTDQRGDWRDLCYKAVARRRVATGYRLLNESTQLQPNPFLQQTLIVYSTLAFKPTVI